VERILEISGREFFFQVLEKPEPFLPPYPGFSFPCLIWDARGSWPRELVDRFADAVIASGCRYAVCAGVDCERWHDWIDESFLAQNLEGPDYEARFVMTSWHTGQSPNEVAFFLTGANFDQHDFRHFVVLQLGASPSIEADLRAAVIAQAAIVAEVDWNESSGPRAV